MRNSGPARSPAMLPVNVFHGHAECRADAGEGKNQEADQRPVAQAHDGRGVDAVEELARLRRRQDRGLAGPNHVFGAPHRGGGIDRQNLADHQPVEQHADGGQPLFHGRRRKPAPEARRARVYVKQAKAGLVAPVEEFAGSPVVGFTGVRVADVRGKEFDEAAAGVLAPAITAGTTSG